MAKTQERRLDPAAQDDTYHQIARILNDDVPQLYLWQLAGVHAVNKRVQGASIGALWYWASLFKDLWVTQ